MSQPLLFGETCRWYLEEEKARSLGVGPLGVLDHIDEWRGAEEGERPHYTDRHCDCSSKLYCKNPPRSDYSELRQIDRGHMQLQLHTHTHTQINLGMWIK